MRGIVLAGGLGTRLYPATLALCKQLLPVFDKPMIYYPLSTLMLAGIREILIISTPDDTPRFQKLFGNGSQFGMQFEYIVQPKPGGLAQALILGASFIQDEPFALILGDNLFHGDNLGILLQEASSLQTGGLIFGYPVKDPGRYGVIEFDAEMRAVSIEEKPVQPKSHYAVPGLYFYGPEAVDIARSLKPSKRGELEITDVNQTLLQQGKLSVQLLGRGHAWLDTGTFDAFHKAGSFVQTIQERQGIQIACLEEIAFRSGWISRGQLLLLAQKYAKNEYGEYLMQVAKEGSVVSV